MKKILAWLQRPYPTPDTHQARWTLSLMLGVVVSFILLLFQPFGLRTIEGIKGLTILGFGAITTGVTLTLLYLLLLLRTLKILPGEWTIIKQVCFLLLLLTIITVCNRQLNVSISSVVEAPQHSLKKFSFMTLAVGLFPLLTVIYFSEKTLRKKNQETADDLTKQLHASQHEPPHLPVPSQDFLYAKAEGNYVHIFSRTESPTLLRLTMKELEKQYIHSGFIIRSHRSFLVNINHVEKISGTASGLILSLPNHVKVPVSRSANAVVKEMLYNRVSKNVNSF